MSKFDLIKPFFDKRHPYEAAFLCSYGLDVPFLERYLMQLRALSVCAEISIVIDRGSYEAILSGDYVPRKLNRDYLVTSLKTNGVFHPKLYLLASEK